MGETTHQSAELSMSDLEFALMKLDSVRSYEEDLPESVPGDDQPQEHFRNACDGLEQAIRQLATD